MTIPALWHGDWPTALVNHLWQSTVVLGIAWLLSIALRRNSARARHSLWMVASVKFLVPFALFMDAGEWLCSLTTSPPSMPAAAAVVQQIATPFPDGEFVNAWASTPAYHADVVPVLLLVAWLCGVVIVVARWVSGWLRIRVALRTAMPLELAVSKVPVFTTSARMEPGIYGSFRPVLLIPEGILKRLTATQLNAVVAHEMCHVRRRDNLMFAVHMIVEAVFWFYPVVWWIGGRLIEERERACDEAVVLADSAAEIYAEGILNVCKYCVESPLGCASGVTGADLKQRIARIMTGNVVRKLDFGKRLMLAAAGFAALAAPFAAGLLHSAQIRAELAQTSGPLPSFEVATVKPAHIGYEGTKFGIAPGRFSVENATVKTLIGFAYDVKTSDGVEGGPRWIDSEKFDVDAKVKDADSEAIQKLQPARSFERYRLMMQSLLLKRFGLVTTTKTEELPVYALVKAKNGPKLTQVESNKLHMPRLWGLSSGELHATSVSMPLLADWISGSAATEGRAVMDRTGLRGSYDFTLNWTPVGAGVNAIDASEANQPISSTIPIDQARPPFFTALKVQLGLKLVAKKAPVEILVIEHVEQPSPN